MRVINDNVLVLVQNEQRTSAAGLYIPETAQEGQVLRGTIVDVGKGKLMENGERARMSVSEKDVIWFPKFNASKIEKDGKTYYVLPETAILAVE